jgi:nitronate monooxygenase
MSKELQPLMIGDLEVPIPIVQGGMGVKVSTASLASAVANCGGAGTIASVGLAHGIDETGRELVEASDEALRNEIIKARELTDGVIGVNIMFALSNYKELVKITVEGGADFIVSGAGLPLNLPDLVGDSPIKLIPIVSSARRYNRLPDAVVVEGPKAGGHIGFKFEDLTSNQTTPLETLVVDVLNLVREYESGGTIPVIAAGGVFDGKDIAAFLALGAQGVQMATRFVVTHECSVADAFKKLYISARQEDVVIIDSPVGMPGRAIRTKFTDRVMSGNREPFRCSYKCLRTCDPRTVPYCIAKALGNAADGDLDNAVVFAGSNVSRVKRIVSVKELMDELVLETTDRLSETPYKTVKNEINVSHHE